MIDVWTRTIPAVERPAPRPDSGVIHGVCLGRDGGAMVTSELLDGVRTATELRRYATELGPIAADVRAALDADPGCVVILDHGLRGRELADFIGTAKPRRRLQLFEATAADRRYEIAGRLSHAIESGNARIKRNLLGQSPLSRALSQATREDAGDRPELVALSLALVDRKPRLPRIG